MIIEEKITFLETELKILSERLDTIEKKVITKNDILELDKKIELLFSKILPIDSIVTKDYLHTKLDGIDIGIKKIDIKMTEINKVVNSSWVSNIGHAEKFSETKIGSKLFSLIYSATTFVTSMVILTMIIFIGSVISKDFSQIITDNASIIFGANGVFSLCMIFISNVLHRKGGDKQDERKSRN